MAHHAELERGDLERLAGGSLAGAVLALWCGLAGWDATLVVTLAGTLGLGLPRFHEPRRIGMRTTARVEARRQRPAVAALGRASHA